MLRAAAMVSLLLGAAQPSFRGCACSDPGVDPPLPRADAGACVTDADCLAAAMCADVRCIGGTCIEVAAMVDRDSDAHAPPPCGDDCDDTDSDIFGGGFERCDGKDNDCDGAVDEGARRLDAVRSVSGGDPTSVVLPWGTGFLVTQATGTAIWGLPVPFDGTVGAPREIMRLTSGSAFTGVQAAAAATDGRILLVASTDTGSRYVIFERGANGRITLLEGPADTSIPAGADLFAVIAFGAGWALGYDSTGATHERLVSLGPTDAPVVTVPLAPLLSPSSWGLATDGTHLVVSDDREQLFFFLPDGTQQATHALVGLSATTPIASFTGSVVAITLGGIMGGDFIMHVTAPGGPGTPQMAPRSAAGTDDVTIHGAAGLLTLTRKDSLGTTVYAVAGDLATYEGAPMSLGTGRVTVTALGNAVGVLTAASLGGNSDLAIIRACSP